MSEKTDLYKPFGKDYTDEELASPHFLYVELAKMGYSISITSIDLQEYLRMRAEDGLGGDPDMMELLETHHCVYTYQLKGNEYESRGAHRSPLLMEEPVQALQVALWNVLRIRSRKGR